MNLHKIEQITQDQNEIKLKFSLTYLIQLRIN